MDFIFKTIPNQLVPFDFAAFEKKSEQCVVTVTDCMTGEPVYYEKSELGSDYFKILQASSSLPLVSHPVEYKGRIFMDGGMSDSIPVKKSIADGNKKNLIVLTQPRSYRKKPQQFIGFIRRKYPEFIGLGNALETRHIMYNDTLDFIETLELRGEAFVIQPSAPLAAGRVERNKDVLYSVYDQGYNDAAKSFSLLDEFLKK